MIAVIADDITGAAEMAGIAHRLGLRVSLTMNPDETPEPCDVLVVATDTRSMTLEDAVAESGKVARAIRRLPDVTAVFKKTDSALRGHVVGELGELITTLGYKDAIYMPANPTKGRVIRDGIYYLGDTPIHLTDFSFDPEFPAFSSRVSERMPGSDAHGIRCLNAETPDDVESIVAFAGADTLLAGAADLFTAFLKSRHPADNTRESDCRLDTADIIFVCGSTQSKPLDCGVPIAYMPLSLYDGATTPAEWVKDLSGNYAARPALILALEHRHRNGKESAVYLRETIAEVVSQLVALHCPRELVIEGGATAFAILRQLGWDKFTITDEIAPGVIRMLHTSLSTSVPPPAGGTHITMKPGSYPWGPLLP